MKKTILPRLHLACANDIYRYSLIEIKGTVACATNGSILVKVDMNKSGWFEFTDDDKKNIDGKFIHANVWKEIHKANHITFKSDCILVLRNDMCVRYEYSTCDKFPNHDAITKDLYNGQEAASIVRIDHRLLSIIGEIFGTESVHLSLSGNNKHGQPKPIVVFSENHSGMCAVIMPVSGTGKERYIF